MFCYYLCATFTLISATVSFGFAVEAYLKAKKHDDSALTNAKYALSRSLSLFLVSIGLLMFISKPYLIALSAIMIGVQLFDCIIGIRISKFKMIGPMFTAFGNIAVLLAFLLKR